MKLNGIKEGWGYVEWSSEEIVDLKEIFNLAEFKQGDALQCSNYYDEKKTEFKMRMAKMFPMVELPHNNHSNVITYKTHIGDKTLNISIRLALTPLKPSYHSGELIIALPIDNGLGKITATTDTAYRPDCIDDVVYHLGERKDPVIYGLQPLRFSPESRSVWWAIPEVPYLEKVLHIYQYASDLITHADKHIGISRDQLNILRLDSKEHENIALRELSAQRYQRAIDDLITR